MTDRLRPMCVSALKHSSGRLQEEECRSKKVKSRRKTWKVLLNITGVGPCTVHGSVALQHAVKK